MDQIDLAPLTLRFLARVQFLRESTQLFRCAPHLPHDTSYFCGDLFSCVARRSLEWPRMPRPVKEHVLHQFGSVSPRTRRSVGRCNQREEFRRPERRRISTMPSGFRRLYERENMVADFQSPVSNNRKHQGHARKSYPHTLEGAALFNFRRAVPLDVAPISRRDRRLPRRRRALGHAEILVSVERPRQPRVKFCIPQGPHALRC